MSLLVWLPLNGDLNNQGLSNAAFAQYNTTGGLGINNSGKISQNCYERTSVTNNAYRSNINFSFAEDVSMCCWAYVSNTPGDSANGLITNHNHADGSGFGITVKQVSTSDYRISCSAGKTGDDRVYHSWYGTTNIKNAWHHLALTYKRSTGDIKLYVDGVCEKIRAGYLGAAVGSNPFDLFNWSTGNISSTNYRPLCKLNDVRLYDHCLSVKEIKEISKGLVLHFPLHGEEGGTNLIKGIAECTATSAGSETLGGPLIYDTSLFPLNSLIGKTFIFSYDYSVEGPKANATGDYSKDRFGSHLTLTYKDASGNAGTAYPGASYLEASGTGRAVQTYTCSSSWTEITGLTIALQPYNKPASGNNNTWYIKNFKIEVGDIDTGYSINPNTLGLASNEISDCSGYGHTGTKVLTSYVKNSPRYDASCAMLGAAVDTTSNTLTGASYITARIPLAASSAMTVSWWGKIVKYGRGGIFETTAYEYDPINGTDYNTTAFANWDSTFGVYNGTSRVNLYSDLVKVDSQWYLHTITYDGSNVKYYRNGTLISTNALAGTLPAITAIRIGIGKAGGVYRQIQQYVSDFRMYVTALSAEDVKELYQIPISIDKSGDMFSLSYDEDQKPEFKKTGLTKAIDFYEILIFKDMEVKTLSDGSCWARILHHNNKGGTVLFTEDNAINYQSTDLYSRLYALEAYRNIDGKFEFMAIQPDLDANKIYRWKQSSNPIIDSTIAGYENITNGQGGLVKCSGATYCAVSSTTNNWWCAVGCYSVYQGGIPGFGSNVVTGTLDLYVRIPSLDKAGIYKKNYILANQIYEV